MTHKKPKQRIAVVRKIKAVSLPVATWELMIAKAAFCANYINAGTKSPAAREAAVTLGAVVKQAVDEAEYIR